MLFISSIFLAVQCSTSLFDRGLCYENLANFGCTLSKMSVLQLLIFYRLVVWLVVVFYVMLQAIFTVAYSYVRIVLGLQSE
jgi:hypothetical protein